MLTESEGGKQARLRAISSWLVARRPLIVASNRGPLEHHLTPDGRLEPRRGAGGVVTALSSLTRTVEFTWVAGAMGEGDRRVSQETPGGLIRSPLPGHRISVRYVVTSRRVYHKYYNVFCNPLLWFLQHYMWNSPYNPNIDASVLDAWDDGYVQVNRAFADVVLEEAKRHSCPPVVMLHDYHLYLVPKYVRDAAPEALVSLFVHIPWPTPRYWQLLPAAIRRAICESLAAADVVGFQTLQDSRNFLATCEEVLRGAGV